MVVNGINSVTFAPPGTRLFYGKPLVFREKAHRYFWGGEPIPSVTTILGNTLPKPALIPWAANMAVDHIAMNAYETFKGSATGDYGPFLKLCEEARTAHVVKKQTAGDLGSETHDYAQRCLEAREILPAPERDDLAQKFVKSWSPEEADKMATGTLEGCAAFRDWYGKHKIEVIDVERQIVSANLFYAGRTDFFGRINGQLGVLDFKTSKGIYDEFWIQLAAYEAALQEELQIGEPLVRWLLHLDKATGKFTFKARAQCNATLQAWASCVMLDKMLRLMKKLDKEAA